MSQNVKAVVDLNAIRFNASQIKNYTKVDVCAVVKANAYGHGAIAVANSLHNLCDMFAVALLSEGIELRCAGIDKEILLLTPLMSDYLRAIEYGITLTVDSIKQVKQISAACKRLNKQAFVHIKFNSGMNRLGCTYLELKNLTTQILQSPFIVLTGIYSHLYDPSCKQAANRQYFAFLQAQSYVKSLQPNVRAHLAASGGILKDSKYNFDMVRPGLMLYGYKPFGNKNISLKRALKIKAAVVKVQSLAAGDSFLYGNYAAQKQSVKLLRLGYADGFLRRQNAYCVNNRCMDISGVSGSGQGVYIIKNFEKLARAQQTIVYEVLTNVTKRAEFEYIN